MTVAPLFLCGGLFFSSLSISFCIVSICLHCFNPTLTGEIIKSCDEISDIRRYHAKYDLSELQHAFNTQEHEEKHQDINYMECVFRETTPVGEVIMVYNEDTQSFEYYCNRQISNKMLETVCKGYILKFNCYHLYVNYYDEFQKRKLVLDKVEEKENEIAANLSESKPEADVFAKFKKYNTRRSSNVVTKTDIMIKTSYNKFKLKGKIHDFDDNSSKSENTKTNEPRPISYEEYKKTKTM